MRHDPHKLIEGCLIAGFAMGANAGYIYIRGEYIRESEALQAAIDEAYDAGLLGKNACGSGWDFDLYRASRRRRLYLRRGNRAARKPGRQEGQPRLKPPFPAGVGPLWLPDHGEQRRDHRRGADHPAPRRGLVRRLRPPEQRRHQALLHLGPCEQALQRGRGDEHPAAAS